jgi:hypothetical protein
VLEVLVEDLDFLDPLLLVVGAGRFLRFVLFSCTAVDTWGRLGSVAGVLLVGASLPWALASARAILFTRVIYPGIENLRLQPA